jgi:hypothetical protein
MTNDKIKLLIIAMVKAINKTDFLTSIYSYVKFKFDKEKGAD